MEKRNLVQVNKVDQGVEFIINVNEPKEMIMVEQGLEKALIQLRSMLLHQQSQCNCPICRGLKMGTAPPMLQAAHDLDKSWAEVRIFIDNLPDEEKVQKIRDLTILINRIKEGG